MTTKYKINNANDIEGTLADHRPYHPIDYIEPTEEIDDLKDMKDELSKLIWIIQEMDCVPIAEHFNTLLTEEHDDPEYEALRLMYDSMDTPEMRDTTERVIRYMSTVRDVSHGRMVVLMVMSLQFLLPEGVSSQTDLAHHIGCTPQAIYERVKRCSGVVGVNTLTKVRNSGNNARNIIW